VRDELCWFTLAAKCIADWLRAEHQGWIESLIVAVAKGSSDG